MKFSQLILNFAILATVVISSDACGNKNGKFKIKNNDSKKTCNQWAKDGKCNKKVDSGKKVKDKCKKACGKCPTESPTASPSEFINVGNECQNDSTLAFDGKADNDCDWVALKKNKRCKKTDPDTQEKVEDSCPGVCKESCKTSSPTDSPTEFIDVGNECQNDSTFAFDGKPDNDCDWVTLKKNKRCKKTDPVTEVKVEDSCPGVCKESCETSSPTDSPTLIRGDCQNDSTFAFDGKADNDCDWVSLKKSKRCIKTDPVTEEKVKDSCPSVCKNKCKNTSSPTSSPTSSLVPTDTPSFSPTDRRDCQDSTTFAFEGDKTKDCSWAAEKKIIRCSKKDTSGEKVKDLCPSVCKTKCQNTSSPTLSPTSSSFPTASPTASPSETTDPTKSPTVAPSATASGSGSGIAPAPTATPTSGGTFPTASPNPTLNDTTDPTTSPTAAPTASLYPSSNPTSD
jgi:hypothetical protein